MNNHFNENISNMESFYIDFGTSRVWFQADETGVTTCDRLVKQFILQRKNDHRLDAMKRIIDKDARHAQEKYKKAQ